VTERTIRSLAKEFAGAWYEQNERSETFRNGTQTVPVVRCMRVKVGKVTVLKEVEFRVPFRVAFPNADAYVEAYWPHWVEHARAKLAEMLGMPDEKISPQRKEQIFAALIEDREREQRQGGNKLRQVREVTVHGDGKVRHNLLH
jgi:hypothetical protein